MPDEEIVEKIDEKIEGDAGEKPGGETEAPPTVEEIAKQMGWKSIRMVEHYGRRVTAEAYRDYLPIYGLHLKQKREPTDQSRLP